MMRFSAIAAVLTVGLTVVQLSRAEDRVLPDTPAGQRAAAYVAAFNSGDEATYRRFESSWRAASALKRRSVEDRVKQYRELYEQYGAWTPQRLLDSGPSGIVLAALAGRGGLYYLDVETEDSAPHKLVGVRVEGPIDTARAERYEQPLDEDMRKRVVERIAAELAHSYVFEEVGKRMAQDLQDRQTAGAYASVTNPYAFARRLTHDLRATCHDKHLRVTPRAPVERSAAAGQPGGRGPVMDNYGFVRAEVLPGNVGYIKLNGFAGSPDARPTAAAAMAFVADTAALIFDLRDNGGGSPDMIVFLSGYLFDEPVHLNSFHDRVAGTVNDTFSARDVPGRRYGAAKPVYVLTSGYTFSAAEEFTYNLKHLGRATLVGETTGGGAHPVRRYSVNKYFAMSVPYARAVNPVTRTNWEGVGVIPHVQVSADQALTRAHELALATINTTRTGAAADAAAP